MRAALELAHVRRTRSRKQNVLGLMLYFKCHLEESPELVGVMSKQDNCQIPPLAASELNKLDEYLKDAWESKELEGWHVVRNMVPWGHRLWVKLEWYGVPNKENTYLAISADLPCYVSLTCDTGYIPEFAPKAFWQCKARFDAWQAEEC